MADSAGVLVCGACGAPVVRTAKACTFCGTAVVLPAADAAATDRASFKTYCPRCATLYPGNAERCPRCPPGNWEAHGGKCPRCAAGLQPTAVGVVTVDVCPACSGRWFDGGEIEHVLDLSTRGVSREDAGALRPNLPPPSSPLEEIRYVACVRCGERMMRRQVAVKTGVVIDICRPHGLWFDGGEFERFEEFVKAGGLEVLRHDTAAFPATKPETFARMPRAGGTDLGEADDSAGIAWGLLRTLSRLSFRTRRWF